MSSSSSHSSSSALRTSSRSATSSTSASTTSTTSSFSVPQTFTPPPFPSPPAGGGTQGGSGGGGGGIGGGGGQQISHPETTSLYLYTFLATLILLLAVSAAIVSRSLILRRRHRRLVAHAIATGAWPPHHGRDGGPKVDLRMKPRMWDAWVQPPSTRGGRNAGQLQEKEGERVDWDAIMPFAAAYSPTPTSASSASLPGTCDTTAAAVTPAVPRSLRSICIPEFERTRALDPAAHLDAHANGAEDGTPRARAHMEGGDGDGEEGPPYLEMGVAVASVGGAGDLEEE
ncbi:hypothetical protein MSAN_01211700 [Mycena sanguinolenta]|uniref:Uncharacterized protein n=1 Tax=Mycena sanguinolenta TaxID=230812 RepID=A0A8H6YGJ7_9AGAR|nr:hypothetical protein MSAN_01211700 [Mycena sanguinolenta]